jgi:ribonuclease J
MNCLAVEHDDGLIVIDCGVTFPTTDLGIDVFHPRFDYLVERRDKLRGVVITHGHEDHIGALPYLLSRMPAPVFGPAHALELVKNRLDEHGIDPATAPLTPTPVRTPYRLGSFEIEHIRVTHSITDATALAIRTRAGTVVHTGDFKIDPAPADGELTDEARLGELGRQGVRLLLSDSTSIDSPGTAGSETDVGVALDELVGRADRAVVIGMFASNVQRLQLLGGIARRHRRHVCLLGRSVGTHVRVAQALGRLGWPSDLLIAPEAAMQTPRDRLLVIASGTQAERPAALARLASATHPLFRVEPGDLVILSSRIIPGNDRAVFDMMAGFLRIGVELVTRVTERRVHASGHAHRDEQLRMIELTQPRAFLPVHGTLHHLMRHASLARDAGVEEVMVVEDGELVELASEGPLRKVGRAPTGRIATYGGEELPEELLRERARIGRAGVAMVSVVLDRHGALAAPPRLTAQGVLDPSDGEVPRAVEKAVARALEAAGHGRSDDELAEIARLAARRTIEAQTGRRPIVSALVTRL